jgi:hypothetical protein
MNNFKIFKVSLFLVLQRHVLFSDHHLDLIFNKSASEEHQSDEVEDSNSIVSFFYLLSMYFVAEIVCTCLEESVFLSSGLPTDPRTACEIKMVPAIKQ